MRAAPWERDEERLLGGTWQQSEIKAGTWTPRKGTHTSQTKQNKERNAYWKTDSRFQTHESEVTASGNDQPFLPAPDLLTVQLVNDVLQNSGDSRETQSDAAAREQGLGGCRGKGKALHRIPLQMPPSSHAALLHSAFLNEASLMKGPCWLKKKFFF